MSESPLAAGIIGESPPIHELRALIARVAPLNLPVLIQGPTGTGKELVAQALHAASGRSGRIVAVNVCALAEGMFEDALFGHVRGAFTGATRDALGYVAEADRGTLFLDETGSLGLPAQAKLLRVIETGDFRPVGARADQHSDFRLVSATNENLASLVRRGAFRADLAHRLAGIVIDVPPLSARLDDIPLLVEHFANVVSSTADGIRFTAGALHALQAHEWTGHVRELRHVVECAIALSGRNMLGRDDVARAFGANGGSHTTASTDFARRRLVRALQHCDWDTARAAAQLGVHRATVYRHMKRYGIAAPQRPVNRNGHTALSRVNHRSHG